MTTFCVSLNAEVGAHDIVCELADFAGGDLAAVSEDAELAGHAARERQFLLHQKHGQTFFLIQTQNNVANFVDDVWLYALGGLIKDQHLRFEDEGAADGELLLLSAGKIAAATVHHLS